MPITRSSFAALIFVLPILLSSCATTRDTVESSTRPNRSTTLIESVNAAEAERAKGSAADANARVFKGTGVLVKGQLPGGGLPPGPVTPAAGGGVVLNFEGADLREVIRNILGDILGESYTIDPAVGGQGDDSHDVGYLA
jgi:general secretion pathway protein D